MLLNIASFLYKEWGVDAARALLDEGIERVTNRNCGKMYHCFGWIDSSDGLFLYEDMFFSAQVRYH